MAVASLSSSTNERDAEMDMSINFEPVYPRHDLLVELGQVEMAIDRLSERDEHQRRVLQPRLESRMSNLLDALNHLDV
jgi:hypothetical protein